MLTHHHIAVFFDGFATAYFVIFAYLILKRRSSTRMLRVTGWIFVFWAFECFKDIVLAGPGGYNQETLERVLMLDGWSAITYLCFLFELTNPGWVTFRRVAVQCVPFVLFTAAYWLWPVEAITWAYIAFLAVYGITMLLVGFCWKRKYTENLYRNYSNVGRMDISWLKYIYLLGFLNMLLWLVVSVVSVPLVDTAYYLFTVIMWQLSLRFVYKHRPEPMPSAELEAVAVPDAPSGEAPDRNYFFAGKLEVLVEEEQLYLDPNLTLAALATRVGTNRTYLSDYFCNVRHVMFYDYINGLRIQKKCVPLMLQHPEYTLEHIAQVSGFNSMATFHRAFKKIMGKTPGRYRQEVQPRP